MIPNVSSCSQLRGSYGADTWLGFMAQVYVLRAQQKLGSSLFFEILISSVEKGQMDKCLYVLCISALIGLRVAQLSIAYGCQIEKIP